MGDKPTYKQALQPGELPEWQRGPIREAELLFKQARFEDLLGNHATAENLRNQAEAIYAELESGQPGQPGAQEVVNDLDVTNQHLYKRLPAFRAEELRRQE